MKFDGARIVCTATGEDFDEFKGHFTDAERGFGYIRIQMGDEMSKRRKFLFLTWIGPEVGVLKRAKMSCDKAIIKEVINVSARKDDPNLSTNSNQILNHPFPEFRGGAAGRVAGRSGHDVVPGTAGESWWSELRNRFP